MTEGDRSTDELTEYERAVLDKYSGTEDRSEAYLEAQLKSDRLRAVTAMPDLPHMDELISVLTAAGQSTEPVMVAAFVDNGLIEIPGTDQRYSVREYLLSGRPPDAVMALADQLKYSM